MTAKTRGWKWSITGDFLCVLIVSFYDLADLTVKDDNKIMTKKPAVQQEVSCLVPPVFLYNYALFTLSENYPRLHTP